DPVLLDKVRLLREYGWTPQERYVSHVEGVNSRLDELQAAILRVRLRHLDAGNAARRRLAVRYAAMLPAELQKPIEAPACRHVYHLYVVQTEQRDRLRAHLAEQGIGSGIHYPVPVHLQPAYAGDAIRAHDLRVTEQAARQVLSLPIYPELCEEQVDAVAAAVTAALA